MENEDKNKILEEAVEQFARILVELIDTPTEESPIPSSVKDYTLTKK